ncbi:MAG: B12-binding domain-containing radical SAM protein [Planctomycetes bacterium]|nr:B12-binding domain-containing radical SAM protein [Planctomycetota bacterium]
MRIDFIRPALGPGRAGDALEPLAFAILAARTPPDVECRLHDERVEEVPLEGGADLAALTVETFTARRAYQMARRLRGQGVPVVMGGYHPTLLPEEAARHADAIVVGDAEAVWPRVVEDARRGRLQAVYQGGYPPLDGPAPERSVFRGKRYGPLSLVQFGRGCRFACDFCSIHAFYGTHRRQRAVGEVVGEIASLDRRRVFFVDDNLFTDRALARTLFQALIPLRVRWSCQASLDLVGDPGLLDLMARSGCASVTVGLESLDAANLRQMGKAWNRSRGSYEEVVAAFRDHGIMVYGTFVFGYDRDTPEAFEATLDFALRSRLFLANFNPLTPTPGTRLYERLRAEGRLIRDPWWLHPDYRYGDALFHPRGMSARELEEGCYRARTAFYRHSGIARRALDVRANLRGLGNATTFLAANLISRREIHRKQGMALGDAHEPAPCPEGAMA